MGAIVMVATNDGVNHVTGYGHEHEKKKGSETHYIPLLSAYEIRQGQVDGSSFFCPRCILDGDEMPKLWPCI